MEIASLCSLPVGVLAWRSPRRALSVITKMTLRLGDAEPALLDPQDALSLDRPSPIGAPRELLYASDFVPQKARCDVLLVGHARASAPSPRIEARLSVGDIERRFFALAAEPSRQIPLSATYLRAADSAASGDVSVGPAVSPARAKHLERARVGPSGVPLGALAADFDFGAFNAAPPEQQLDQLPPGVVIELDALLPGQPRLRAQLPSERPRLYARDRGARGGRLVEVPLRCDTLWIDTDRAVCSLVWRGIIELARDDAEPPELALTLAPFGLSEPRADLERRLEGAPRARAAEASDFHEPIADEETPAPPRTKSPPAEARAPGLLSLSGPQLGAQRPPASDDPEEKTALHAIPARAPTPPAPAVARAEDEGAEEIAAEELLDFEEIEPDEDLADEPTPMPSPKPPAAPERPVEVGQPPELRSKSFVVDDSESTQTNFQIPKQEALPFETDRPTPVPPAPDSASGSRPSYPVLPFKSTPPSDALPFKSPPASDALPFKSPSPDALPFRSPSPSPDALPFKSPSPSPDALPFKSPSPSPSPPSDALPFKSPSPPSDALPFKSSSPPSDALPFKSPSPPPDALPFKSPSLPSDALPFKPPSKRKATHVDSLSPQVDPTSALPFVRPAEPPRAKDDLPSAAPPVLPFIKTAPDIPSNPVVMPPDVPSALPFAKPAEPAPKNPPNAPLPAAAFPFLRPLIPVTESAPDLAAPQKPRQSQPQAPALLPLDTYADIQIDLWDEGAVLEDVLARHGIDEITWRDNEQRRAEALAAESAQGRSDLALALAEALDAALLRRASTEHQELSLDEYIAVRVAVEATAEPEPVLASKNLSEAKWQKLDRAWRKRARSDKALAKDIRTKLAEARKAAVENTNTKNTNTKNTNTKNSPKRRKARSRASGA